ncbi:sensor histidine kinase KdpD [Listeria fleischmannii FSL S10-1203]|uniref:Sensor histidine kinase KdpD n=1 Tax=Listeria fleischmannii FSL S10-1203 TaxID=1265822 RepID=W7DDE4_9LIST|nr:sensor histidine kinase KdpD [Listeria fleischmannii FSL S10-1203]
MLGKSKRKSFLLGKFGADLEDELIDSLQAIEIHIIPSSRKEKTKTHAWTLKNIVTWHDTAKMFAALILATLLSAGLSELGIGDQNIIMVYILSVLVISRITTGYLYGIIGSLLAVLIF